MASADTYYIGDKAITSGGKVHNRHAVVTAEVMKVDDDLFNDLVKAGRVKKGKPPKNKSKAAKAAKKPVEKKQPEDKKPEDKKPEDKKPEGDDNNKPVLREGRIYAAVEGLFKEDGSRISDDDFTQDGKPNCDKLNLVAILEGEELVTSDERDAAWEKYQADKATK